MSLSSRRPEAGDAVELRDGSVYTVIRTLVVGRRLRVELDNGLAYFPAEMTVLPRPAGGAEALRKAITRLTAVAETAPESLKTGLDHAVGVLLDMVTGLDNAGGAS